MLRPERMTSVSIVCVKNDVEDALEALNKFGEFHIEQAAPALTAQEYGQAIQKAEQTLSDINSITNQLKFEKPKLTDIFKTPRYFRVQVTAENWQTLQEQVSSLVRTLKEQVEGLYDSRNELEENRMHLSQTKRVLGIMQRMGADLAAMDELKLLHVTIASVPNKDLPQLEDALSGKTVFLRHCKLTKTSDFVYLAFPAKYREEIERVLKLYRSEIFRVPSELPRDTKQAQTEVEGRLKAISEEKKHIKDSLQKLGEANQKDLITWKETIQNTLALLEAERKIARSDRLATIKGFVPKKQFCSLEENVVQILSGKVLVFCNEDERGEDPPTLLRHNRFVKPFEEITKLYGLPSYDELDPTSIIAISFPLIFGFMFGDIGHGLLLLGGGLVVGRALKNNSGMKNLCFILAACGLGSVIAGMLYGEFFGTQLFPPLWFSPFENVLSFLIFSLVIGVIQIASGLVMEAINFLLKHNPVDAFLTSVPKIAFYMGSVYLIAAYQLNFAAWFSGPILFAIVPFLFLILAKPVFLWGARMSTNVIELPAEEASLGQRIFESGDLVTRLLSNTISYARILALLMAHWALIYVTYIVAGLVVASELGWVVGGFIIVFGNIFVLALEGLIVFIHTLRLHFYEWFSKFYLGNGTEFTPFRQNFIYTKVVLNGKPRGI